MSCQLAVRFIIRGKENEANTKVTKANTEGHEEVLRDLVFSFVTFVFASSAFL